jgi:short-subunit dehydrogenase
LAVIFDEESTKKTEKMKVKNKVFVVTGGGSGIGRELVLALLKRGAKVAAIDRNETTLAETLSLAGLEKDRLSTHILDITRFDDIQALPEKVIARHGQVDGLINNAGIIQPFVLIKDLPYDAIERVMNINFYGTLHLTKSFLPYLLARPEAHIANVSSMGGFLPVPGQSVYGASKAAVKLFTEGLYSELLNTPVRVTIIFPGAIATNITVNSGVSIPNPDGQNSKKSSFKAMPADQAAAVMLDAIEQNKFRVLVGSDARFMDFLSRLSPGFATRFIYNKMKSLLPS